MEQQETQTTATAPETIKKSVAEGMLTSTGTLSTAVTPTTSGAPEQRL